MPYFVYIDIDRREGATCDWDDCDIEISLRLYDGGSRFAGGYCLKHAHPAYEVQQGVESFGFQEAIRLASKDPDAE